MLADVEAPVGPDAVVDRLLDRREVLGGEGGEVAEVEAQAVGLDQRAGLGHVVAQPRAEGGVEQVGGGVGATDSVAAGGVDRGLDGRAAAQLALDDARAVQPVAGLVAAGVEHLGS